METKSVLFAKFPQESQAYEALSQLNQRSSSDQHTVLQAAVVEKGMAGDMQFKDGFSTEQERSTDWFKGGLLGAVVGIIGGPIGILLGGGIGALVGTTVTADKIQDQETLLENSMSDIDANNPFIIAFVDEEDTNMLNNLFKDVDPDTIIRRKDAGEVAQDIKEAEQAQSE